MGKKLYVGNLAYSVTSDDLGNLFSQYGDVVDAVVINDKFSVARKVSVLSNLTPGRCCRCYGSIKRKRICRTYSQN